MYVDSRKLYWKKFYVHDITVTLQTIPYYKNGKFAVINIKTFTHDIMQFAMLCT